MTKVEVEFTFKGWVIVDGDENGNDIPIKEAKEIVKAGFGVIIDTPHTSDDRIIDWDISTHPDNIKYS